MLIFRMIALLMVIHSLPLLASNAQSPTKPPNIVILLADDSGYNEYSLNGSKEISTPRIDSIARNGIRFTQGYTSCSYCSPTRAGLLTGRYQHRYGHEYNVPPAYSEVNGLSLDETTMADVFKAANYRTIALGKWHLGYAPKFHPLERGFTDYYGFLQGSRSYFPLAKPSRLNHLWRDREPKMEEKFEYMTDHLAEEAAAYIRTYKDQPFLMYLAFNGTHGPLHATKADLEKTGGDKVKAMALAVDRGVGIVLDELQQHSLKDNTLVFFFVDNGGAGGRDNTPLREHKGTNFEGGIRVPFAVQWPAKLPKGQDYKQPIMSLDIFPTAMAAAGIQKQLKNPLDGVNLLPFLTGENQSRPHQTLFWKNQGQWAVREGDLKLVGTTEKKGKPLEPALFDLAKDVSETTDLAANRPDDVNRLKTAFNEWKKDFPPPTWGRNQKDDEAN
jgi:arylsulfatase A-like enzyme